MTVITEKTTEANATTGPVDEFTPDEATSHLKQLKEQHHWDPNLPDKVFDEINDALQTSDKSEQEGVTHELTDNSPYPNNTFCAWAIGLLLSTIGSALNMFFSVRKPYIVIPSYVAQVVAYPIGRACDKVIPNRTFKFFGIKVNLNHGSYSKKEHAISVIMANATFGGGAAYATDVLLAQRAFYNNRFGWGFELLMTSQPKCWASA